jgi:hypothetical protein
MMSICCFLSDKRAAPNNKIVMFPHKQTNKQQTNKTTQQSKIKMPAKAFLMQKCYLALLPGDILRLLLPNYFLPSEDQNKTIFCFSRDWRNFMNTQKDFQIWKKLSQLIILKFPLADMFYDSLENSTILKIRGNNWSYLLMAAILTSEIVQQSI